MDRMKRQSFEWLPAQMPGVAALMKEKRAEFGDEWVTTCWRKGVQELQPGWFYAGEGALAVGVLWDDPLLVAWAAARVVPRTQALVVMRPPPGGGGE